MFQFTGFARTGLWIQPAVVGLPHSDIFGSMLASSSPKPFVGRHVLLRLCVPRDPPLALCSLTTILGLSFFDVVFPTPMAFLYAVFKVLAGTDVQLPFHDLELTNQELHRSGFGSSRSPLGLHTIF